MIGAVTVAGLVLLAWAAVMPRPRREPVRVETPGRKADPAKPWEKAKPAEITWRPGDEYTNAEYLAARAALAVAGLAAVGAAALAAGWLHP